MPSDQIYHKDYYITYKEKISNYNKSYRLANKQYFLDYYKKNKDHLNKYYKKYYDKNLQRCRKKSIIIPEYTKFPPLKKINKKVIITFD